MRCLSFRSDKKEGPELWAPHMTHTHTQRERERERTRQSRACSLPSTWLVTRKSGKQWLWSSGKKPPAHGAGTRPEIASTSPSTLTSCPSRGDGLGTSPTSRPWFPASLEMASHPTPNRHHLHRTRIQLQRLGPADLTPLPISLHAEFGSSCRRGCANVAYGGLGSSSFREVSHAQLRPLCAQGKTGISNKVPLELSNYCAAEAVCGPPLGACAVRDPRLEVATRRMRWLVTLANQVGLVGTVHRHLATLSGPTWAEPSAALSSTLQELRWMVVVNGDSMRASHWPHLDPEPSYRGEVHLEPKAASPPSDAVWTDGSIKADGGAAAVQPASQTQFLRAVKRPHSSTQCQWLRCCWSSTFTLQVWS